MEKTPFLYFQLRTTYSLGHYHLKQKFTFHVKQDFESWKEGSKLAKNLRTQETRRGKFPGFPFCLTSPRSDAEKSSNTKKSKSTAQESPSKPVLPRQQSKKEEA